MKIPQFPDGGKARPYLDDMPEEWRGMTVPDHYKQLALIGNSMFDSLGKDYPRYRGMNAAAEIYKCICNRNSTLHKGRNFSNADMRDMATEIAMAMDWVEYGCPRFVLPESLTAMLSMTKAPPMVWDHLPMPCFVVELPHKYLPIPTLYNHGVQLTHLVIGKWEYVNSEGSTWMGTTKAICEPYGRNLTGYHFYSPMREDCVQGDSDPFIMKMMMRFIANAVAYITQYKECVVPRVKSKYSNSKSTQQVFDVKIPNTLRVERTIRDNALRLIAARSFSARKAVLQHWVTGHWKNQVHGEGRKERTLKWVEPYRRGNQDLGTVVERILHVEGQA